MKLEQLYNYTKFDVKILQAAIEVFEQIVQELTGDVERRTDILNVSIGRKEWQYDDEDEFFAEYPNANGVHFYRTYVERNQSGSEWFELELNQYVLGTDIAVRAKRREQILKVTNVFDHCEDAYKYKTVPKGKDKPKDFTIFIGHGQNNVWKELKEHLREKQGYTVQAYESTARAGHAIRDILEGLLDTSALAFLVMSCDDEIEDDKFRARQNVIHETGLFQGKLGFAKAIVLVEDGVEGYSNLNGIQQIRFSKNNIKETFGEVVATIRREISN